MDGDEGRGRKKDRGDAGDWRAVGGVGVGWQKVRGRVERNGENKRGERRRENKQKKRKIGERGSRHWLFRPTAHIGDYVY